VDSAHLAVEDHTVLHHNVRMMIVYAGNTMVYSDDRQAYSSIQCEVLEQTGIILRKKGFDNIGAGEDSSSQEVE
jgi:hypothetical protein